MGRGGKSFWNGIERSFAKKTIQNKKMTEKSVQRRFEIEIYDWKKEDWKHSIFIFYALPAFVEMERCAMQGNISVWKCIITFS